MGLNCGASLAKYVLFAFNVIFFLGGAAVLGVGIWLRVDTGSFTEILDKVNPTGDSKYLVGNALTGNVATIHTIAYVLIAIGCFVFVVGFMGCCGACKEWRPLLVGYAVCLVIIMCVEIGIGIAVGVYKSEVREVVNRELKAVIVKYDYIPTYVDADGILKTNLSLPDPNTVKETAAVNALQAWFGCCGIYNYLEDFQATPYARKSGSALIPPAFCCKFSNPTVLKLADQTCNILAGRTNPAISNFQTGCVTKVEAFVDKNAPAVIGVTVGIGLIELIGVFFAFCLCCSIGDKHRGFN